MKNFLRKKVEVVPDSPHNSPLGTNGTSNTPLYSRFASTPNISVQTPAISGPVSLAPRVDTHSRLVRNGKGDINSPKQNRSMLNLSPPSRTLDINKPLPTQEDNRPSSPLVVPALDPPAEEQLGDVLLWDYEKVVSGLLSIEETGASVKRSLPTTELRRPLRPNVPGELSFARPSSSSSSSSNSMPPSASQRFETAAAPPKSRESEPRSRSRPSIPLESPSRGTFKKTHTSLLGNTATADPNTMQSNTAKLPPSQPDFMKKARSHNNAALLQRQSLQATPSQHSTPQLVLPPEQPNADTVKDSHASREPLNRHLDPVGMNPSRSRSESSPATFDRAPERKIKRENSGRAPHFGPRASLRRGPSTLVQGQPRIFASRADSDQQDPPVLKPGQPRIFAMSNSDSSPPRSQSRQSDSHRYASPIDTNPTSSKPSQSKATSLGFRPITTRDKPNTAEPTSTRTVNSSRAEVVNRSPPSSAPPLHNSTTDDHNSRYYHARQWSVDHMHSMNDNISGSRPDYRGKSFNNPQLRAPVNSTIITNTSHATGAAFSPEIKNENSNGIHKSSIQTQSGSVMKDVPPTVERHQWERPSSPGFRSKRSDVPPQAFMQTSQATDPSRGILMQTPIASSTDHGTRGPPSVASEILDDATTQSSGKTTPVLHPGRLQIPSPYMKSRSRSSLQSFDVDGSVSTKGASDQSEPIVAFAGLSSHQHPMVDTKCALETDRDDNPTEAPQDIKYYSLELHLSEPSLLARLLQYLTFRDWCALYSLNKKLRTRLAHTSELKEEVLESYLKTIGYSRWMWNDPEPLTLSLRDLSEYMRGVSLPTHQYARISETYLKTRSSTGDERTVCVEQARTLSFATRAYSRVVIRLRLQAEAIARYGGATVGAPNGVVATRSPRLQQRVSRTSSRAPSPMSTQSHALLSHTSRTSSDGHGIGSPNAVLPRITFASPIYRPRRAPLLRVFVPSPEGEDLSDASVVECEAELSRAGITHLLRPGDAVWDTAVGDEGNAGRMVWDGNFLLDLDYSYSRAGDLPRYLPSLAFAPSYFHRVIRISGNPIIYIDLGPWAEQIAMNLQLLQDRVRTETPQGNHHTIVRWVHRSHFEISSNGGRKIQIPFGSGNWTVDRGWHGTVVVEAEGTNEGLADLQDRCRAAFPARASGRGQSSRAEEKRRVFRILRERSKPGEIWIRTVSDKERLLP